MQTREILFDLMALTPQTRRSETLQQINGQFELAKFTTAMSNSPQLFYMRLTVESNTHTVPEIPSGAHIHN